MTVFDKSTWTKARVIDARVHSWEYAPSVLGAVASIDNHKVSATAALRGRLVLVEPSEVDVLWATYNEGETFALLYPYEFERISA